MSNDAINLEYKMDKEEEIRYRTIVDSDQSIKENDVKQDMNSRLEMVMLQKCKNIDSDGTMKIDVTIESGSLKRDGQEEPLPNVGQVISMTMKKNGDIVKTSDRMPFTQPPFPSKSIRKKDTWQEKSTVEIPGRVEPITLNYQYILWDFTEADGYECAEIKVSCPENRVTLQEGVEQVLSATGTTYFSHKEGMLIKSEVETKTDITAPNNAAVKTHIKVRVELIETKKVKNENDENNTAQVDPNNNGAGFGEPETNKEVEERAVNYSKKALEKEGWSVISVESSKNCGYDLECTKETEEINVEVKGVQGSNIAFNITDGEYRQAKSNSKFLLYVVTNALDKPKLTKYSGKDFIDSFSLKPLSYRAKLK